MAKLITQFRDNDCNCDMLKNGENRLLRYLIEENLIDVLIDVGANIGDYTSMVLTHNTTVGIYAFEPVPRTLGILRQNHSNSENVTIVEKALSDTEE